MSKKYFYLLVFFCVVLFSLFLYLVYKSLVAAPTAPPAGEEEVHFELPTEQESAVEIGNLIDKTPYRGRYFSFTYSDITFRFTVNIDPANRAEGEKEFNEFLKQNGIPNRSDIVGLITTNDPLDPTPEP